MSIEQAEVFLRSGDPSFEMTAISMKFDQSPKEASQLLRVESPLVEGEHSYLLTLQHESTGKPFILLSLEDFRAQDIGEQSYIVFEKAKERVRERWEDQAKLLRVGEIRISPHHIFELGEGIFPGTDVAITDMLRVNTTDKAISVQRD